MFGTYRTILALIVVIHHLISVPVIGHYAVHGFFILSGYLMTYVMCNSYGYTSRGLWSFAANRFLRLFPSYWVILFLTVFLILIFGEENTVSYRQFIFLPDSIISWLQNASLIYFDIFPGKVSPRLSPPTWALTIELLFYLLIALGISKSKILTSIWFVTSILYMCLTHFLELGYQYRYNIIVAGSLPFSIGAMIFHYYKSLTDLKLTIDSSWLAYMLFGAFILNCCLGTLSSWLHWADIWFNLFFYCNYLINSLMILYLVKGKVPFISLKFDKKLGDFSYPIYLIHWQSGLVASMLLWSEPLRGFNTQGIVTLFFALIICFAFSFLIIRFIDTPIEKLRKKIKANKQLKQQFTQKIL